MPSLHINQFIRGTLNGLFLLHLLCHTNHSIRIYVRYYNLHLHVYKVHTTSPIPIPNPQPPKPGIYRFGGHRKTHPRTQPSDHQPQTGYFPAALPSGSPPGHPTGQSRRSAIRPTRQGCSRIPPLRKPPNTSLCPGPGQRQDSLSQQIPIFGSWVPSRADSATQSGWFWHSAGSGKHVWTMYADNATLACYAKAVS